MIGSKADARLAMSGHGRVIGEGSTRVCRLLNGVVYKVEIDHGESIQFNQMELDNLEYLSTKTPETFKIPKWQGIYVGGLAVVAMELVKGGTAVGECFCNILGIADPRHGEECLPSEVCSEIQGFGINDVGYGNVIMSNGEYYLIDLGE